VSVEVSSAGQTSLESSVISSKSEVSKVPTSNINFTYDALDSEKDKNAKTGSKNSSTFKICLKIEEFNIFTSLSGSNFGRSEEELNTLSLLTI
jgi:hypothetical protein